MPAPAQSPLSAVWGRSMREASPALPPASRDLYLSPHLPRRLQNAHDALLPRRCCWSARPLCAAPALRAGIGQVPRGGRGPALQPGGQISCTSNPAPPPRPPSLPLCSGSPLSILAFLRRWSMQASITDSTAGDLLATADGALMSPLGGERTGRVLASACGAAVNARYNLSLLLCLPLRRSCLSLGRCCLYATARPPAVSGRWRRRHHRCRPHCWRQHSAGRRRERACRIC